MPINFFNSVKESTVTTRSKDPIADAILTALRDKILSIMGKVNASLAVEGLDPINSDLVDQIIADKGDQFMSDIVVPPLAGQPGDYQFDFQVSYKPQLKLVETPYAVFDMVKVFESPPVTPIAFIYPLIDRSDRFIICVTPSSGEVIDYPINILPEDDDYFKNVLVSQESKNGKVHFQQEGQTTGFQVFKLDYRPQEYTQFKLYKELEFPFYNSFTEIVETNTPLYYCFRSLDIHGGVSNPTEIFKIQIVENSGVFYPVIEIVDLYKPQVTVPTMPFKKFIKISPSLSQTLYNEDKEKIGLLNESIFDRKFKLRFSSKHTQKKFDVILTFTKNIKTES